MNTIKPDPAMPLAAVQPAPKRPLKIVNETGLELVLDSVGSDDGPVTIFIRRNRPTLDHKAAMQLAKKAYANTSAEKEDRNSQPTPAPYITMTAGNLLHFFRLATQGYKP